MKKILGLFLVLVALTIVSVGIFYNKKTVVVMPEAPVASDLFATTTAFASSTVEIVATSTSVTATTTVVAGVAVLPKTIYPGDPVYITVDSAAPKVTSIFFDSKKLSTFTYAGRTRAFVAIDFNEKVLAHTIKVTFADSSTSTKKITLTPRKKIERPLGIPESLGGNTTAAEKALLANLAKENAILNSVKTASTTLWKTAFAYPLKSIYVTDDYGYNRLTLDSTIVHKGTDFRAPEGTSVMAMNDGVVRVSQLFIVYGNAIIIDHGLGVQSMYMHLSKPLVKAGDIVKKGQIIGLSGKTGYAESPHLHVSIKIGGISIDPVTFMSFFK